MRKLPTAWTPVEGRVRYLAALDAMVGGAMPEYRLYYLNSSDHIIRAVELDCHDDVAAETEAFKRRDGHVMELWQRARLVRRFERDA